MTDVSPLMEPAPPPEPGLAREEPPRVLSISVEAMTDSHRLKGELSMGHVARRLVDIVNSLERGLVVINACKLDDPFKDGDNPRQLNLVQVHRDAILYIIPRGPMMPSDPFEVVKKVAVACTLVVPGFEISGNVFLMPDADPETIPLIGTHHFIPVTDATVSAANGRSEVWREPVVLVNMTRALLYGPHVQSRPALNVFGQQPGAFPRPAFDAAEAHAPELFGEHDLMPPAN